MKSNSKIPYANPVRWGGLAGMVAGVMAILWHRLPLPRAVYEEWAGGCGIAADDFRLPAEHQ